MGKPLKSAVPAVVYRPEPKCKVTRVTNRSITPPFPLNFAAAAIRNLPSIAKKFLEPLRRQGGIARRILNIAMPEIGLDRARVVAVIGELVAAGMAQHVGVRLDAQIGDSGCPLDHAGEAGRR